MISIGNSRIIQKGTSTIADNKYIIKSFIGDQKFSREVLISSVFKEIDPSLPDLGVYYLDTSNKTNFSIGTLRKEVDYYSPDSFAANCFGLNSIERSVDNIKRLYIAYGLGEIPLRDDQIVNILKTIYQSRQLGVFRKRRNIAHITSSDSFNCGSVNLGNLGFSVNYSEVPYTKIFNKGLVALVMIRSIMRFYGAVMATLNDRELGNISAMFRTIENTDPKIIEKILDTSNYRIDKSRSVTNYNSNNQIKTFTLTIQ